MKITNTQCKKEVCTKMNRKVQWKHRTVLKEAQEKSNSNIGQAREQIIAYEENFVFNDFVLKYETFLDPTYTFQCKYEIIFRFDLISYS